MSEEQQWKYVIEPSKGVFGLKLRDLWQYRDLIYLFVKRDFISMYKQTILGPLWAIINPVLSTVFFTVIFGTFAKLTTMDTAQAEKIVVPSFLFYMIGNILWEYFSGTAKAVSDVFVHNAEMMKKVYYPRLTVPIASAIFGLLKLFIQLILFIILLGICVCNGSAVVAPSPMLAMFPLLIVQLMLFGLGVGFIISSLTAKYRDLILLVDFGLQLWLYATPVAYGLQLVPEKWFGFYMLNPLTSIFTAIRYLCFGEGYFNLKYYALSWAMTVMILMVGITLFNRTEKNFVDFV